MDFREIFRRAWLSLNLLSEVWFQCTLGLLESKLRHNELYLQFKGIRATPSYFEKVLNVEAVVGSQDQCHHYLWCRIRSVQGLKSLLEGAGRVAR